MDCDICFVKRKKFKLLNCGHFNCVDCSKDLAKGKRVLSSAPDLKNPKGTAICSSTSTETTTVIEEDRHCIECPLCRKVTLLPKEKGVDGLRTKHIGELFCRQCDESKSVSEFRWCRTCNTTVCSPCFLEKHAEKNPDGSLCVHESNKWEEFGALEMSLSQLKMEVTNANESVATKMEYLNKYLQALCEYLQFDLNNRAKTHTQELEKQAVKLCDEFGLDWDSIQPSKFSTNGLREYALQDLMKLTGVDINLSSLDLKINSIAYPEIGRHVFASKTIPFDPFHIDSSIMEESIRSSFVVGPNLIQNPVDIILVDSVLVISDGTSGLFLFQTWDYVLSGPLRLRQGYHQFDQIVLLPKTNEFTVPKHKNVLMLNARYNNQWSTVLIGMSSARQLEHIEVGHDKNHAHNPANHPMSMMGSAESVFGLTPSTLFKLNPLRDDKKNLEIKWKEVYKIDKSSPVQYVEIGHVAHKDLWSELYLINIVWGSLDLIHIQHENDQVCGFQRIPLPQSFSFPIDPTSYPSLTFWNDELFMVDKDSGSVIEWNVNKTKGRSFQTLCTFRNKRPEKLLLCTKEKNVYAIMETPPNTYKLRSLELFKLPNQC